MCKANPYVPQNIKNDPKKKIRTNYLERSFFIAGFICSTQDYFRTRIEEFKEKPDY